MTTVIHQLRKDIGRYALWLAVWAVVCVLPLGVLAIPPDAIMAYAAVNTITPGLRFFVFIVLTVLVVQEDPVIGSTAFWLTRPIGWQQLLASKLLFMLGLLVLPAVMVDIAHMASTGVGLPYVLLAVSEITLDWIVWGTGVLAVSALSTTLPGFLGAIFKVALLAIAVHWFVGIASAMAYGQSLGDWLNLQVFLAINSMSGELDPWREAPSRLASRALR